MSSVFYNVRCLIAKSCSIIPSKVVFIRKTYLYTIPHYFAFAYQIEVNLSKTDFCSWDYMCTYILSKTWVEPGSIPLYILLILIVEKRLTWLNGRRGKWFLFATRGPTTHWWYPRKLNRGWCRHGSLRWIYICHVLCTDNLSMLGLSWKWVVGYFWCRWLVNLFPFDFPYWLIFYFSPRLCDDR